MRKTLAALFGISLCQASAAGVISSEYTDIDRDRDCTIFAAAAEGEGDWANLVCSGWRGYPVLIYTGDLRESVFYGFPPAGDLAPAWESFSAFNFTAPKIEWRIDVEDGVAVPFATIHRWFVSELDSEAKTEVLVVAKVGQLHAREGCAVGLVLASGNPGANEMARNIADEQARDFACGADERVYVGEPIPQFSRAD